MSADEAITKPGTDRRYKTVQCHYCEAQYECTKWADSYEDKLGNLACEGCLFSNLGSGVYDTNPN